MSFRALVAALLLVALAGAGTGPALAQKTKIKPGTQQQTTEQDPVSTLDPSDPEELKEIIAEADAAYFVAKGEKPDYDYAFKMYELAAEAGDTYSQNRLALMYDRGESVEQDYTKAFEWYLKAAEGGLPAAQSNVGSMYDAGDGVKQDFTEAMRWYKLAAENGYAFAMYAIGDLYLAGEGVPEDAKTAAEWYQKASDNGEPNGHWALALRYLYGDGVTRDTTYAAELAYLALTNGLQVALDEFKAIDEADTPANFRRKLQQLLKDDGFYKGPIDGNFGPATIKAMEAAFDTVV